MCRFVAPTLCRWQGHLAPPRAVRKGALAGSLVLILLAGCPGPKSRAPVPVPIAASSAPDTFRPLTADEKALVVATVTHPGLVDAQQPPQVVAAQSLHATAGAVPELVRLAQLPPGETSAFVAANALAGLLRTPEGRHALLALFPSLPERRREWVMALAGQVGKAPWDRRPPGRLLAAGLDDPSPKVRARARRAEKALNGPREGGAR